MLTVKKIITTEEVQAYLDKENIHHPIATEQFMGMYDGDGLIGIGSIELRVTKVYMNFIYIEGNDMALKHGLAKALLNMADLSGIKTVYGDEPLLSDLYSLLRFKKEDDEYVLSLQGYFTTDSCQH